MGTIALSKQNRLFWLGRYVERAFTVIGRMSQCYDNALDGPEFDFAEYCRRLDLPTDYSSDQDFFIDYLFNGQNPNSVISSVNFAYDNAIVLRETISSSTLSYLQLAKNVMDNAVHSTAPLLDLQQVVDYLMAFKGCVDEVVAEEDSRVVIKCGFTVERIDLYLRLDWRLDQLDKEFGRLASRLQRTRMQRDAKRLRLLVDLVPCPNPQQNKAILIDCVENLFLEA